MRIISLLLIAILAGFLSCTKEKAETLNNNTDPIFITPKAASVEAKKFINDIRNEFVAKFNPSEFIQSFGQLNTDHIFKLGTTGFVIYPTERENKLTGFILKNSQAISSSYEYYKFGSNYIKGTHTLSSKDAFLLSLIINKQFKNITKYEFSRVSQMPVLFRKFTKMEQPPAHIKAAKKITVHIGIDEPVQSTSLLMVISFPVCQTRICGTVELPNLIFIEECWFQSGCDGDPWGYGGHAYFADPYSTDGSGGYNSSVESMLYEIDYILNLPSDTETWLIQSDPNTIIQSFFYLQNSSSPDKEEIIRTHIEEMKSSYNDYMNPDRYWDFVEDHRLNSGNNFLWWEDDSWLDNPNNFNLDLDFLSGGPGSGYKKLTAAEKALAKKHPMAAFTINQNQRIAREQAIAKMGTNGLNDKSDAFRHAFFQAINTVRIGASLTQQFADAHETETPSLLGKEKIMDLANNSVGIAYGQTVSTIYWTVDIIANGVFPKVANGELWYLKPIDINDPNFWGAGGNNPNTATHGLTNAVLIPTNL